MKDIVLSKVNKAYGTQQVLRDFSAIFPAGGATALLGASGRGKTTLARLVLGLEVPDSGTLTGADVHFACVFQEDCLCPPLSAVDNVALVLPRGQRPRAHAALEALCLAGPDLEKPAGALSGGQKRRVALARAMEAESEAVVLDEAFKGLDDDTRQKAYAYIQSRLAGRTLLLITHEAQDAEALGAAQVVLP